MMATGSTTAIGVEPATTPKNVFYIGYSIAKFNSCCAYGSVHCLVSNCLVHLGAACE